MSRRLCVAFTCIVALSCSAAAADSEPAPTWAAAVDALMAEEMTRAEIPGAQVAIAQDGRVVYARAYGVADVESGRKVTNDTLFQAGSVAKLVTGVLLAQLAVDGVIDLKAPIARYVTELRGREVGKATAHQLLTHSAGWADVANPFGRTDDAAAGDVLKAAPDAWAFIEPGRVYSYSNNGFAMAGYVAERAASTPFAQLVEQRILAPLAHDYPTYKALVAMTRDISLGYVELPGQGVAVQRPMPGNAAELGAGFLYVSASDLARLGVALMSGGEIDGKRVFAREVVDLVTGRYIDIPGSPKNASGYGVQVDEVGDERVWRKAGSVVGFSSELSMWPDRRFAVAISANRQGDFPIAMNVRVAQVVHDVAKLPEPEREAETVGTAAQRADVAGRYFSSRDESVEIVDRDGQLQFLGKRGTFPVVFVARDVVLLKAPAPIGREFTVLRDKDGRVEFLHSRARAFRRERAAQVPGD